MTNDQIDALIERIQAFVVGNEYKTRQEAAAALRELKMQADVHHGFYLVAIEQKERAEAERDSLRADAERINWCEKQWADGIHIEYCAIGIGDVRVIPAGTVFLRNKEYKGDSIRAAIDAAIAASKEQR